jgi:hypothetical protein
MLNITKPGKESSEELGPNGEGGNGQDTQIYEEGCLETDSGEDMVSGKRPDGVATKVRVVQNEGLSRVVVGKGPKLTSHELSRLGGGRHGGVICRTGTSLWK